MTLFAPFRYIADWITYGIFQIEQGTQLGDAIHFFVLDSLKLFALLFFITYLMSLIRYYLPITRIRDFLTTHNLYGLDYLFAAVFGAVTPFCSCSSIPLFIGFLEARIPLGVTFAFMITSPILNEVAIALFFSFFGWEITLFYILAGLGVGVGGGYVLGKLGMEKYVADFIWNIKAKSKHNGKKPKPFSQAFPDISREALGVMRQIWIYIVVGIAIGAGIHGYIPEGFFEQYLEAAGFWGVPVAVLLAVPMYANASGVIPIIFALVEKGVPVGTALAFMMAVVGLSLPEALILQKVLQWQLLGAFFGVVTVGIIGIGYACTFIFGL